MTLSSPMRGLMVYSDYEPKLKELFKQLDEAAKVLKTAQDKKFALEGKLSKIDYSQAASDFENLKKQDVVNLPTYIICKNFLKDGKAVFDGVKVALLASAQEVERVKAVIVTLKANYEALVEAQRKSLNNVLQFKNGKRKSKRPNKARS